MCKHGPSWNNGLIQTKHVHVCLVTQSCLTLFDSLDCSHRLFCPLDFPGNNNKSGLLFCGFGTQIEMKRGGGVEGDRALTL